MGKKSTPQNVERPQSAQELQLLETQNQQLQKGIAVAEQQEARSNEQHQIWKDNYLPMEVSGGANMDSAAGKKFDQRMDNQMPRYAEDTSGVRGPAQQQPAPQQPAQQQARIGSGPKGGQ